MKNRITKWLFWVSSAVGYIPTRFKQILHIQQNKKNSKCIFSFVSIVKYQYFLSLFQLIAEVAAVVVVIVAVVVVLLVEVVVVAAVVVVVVEVVVVVVIVVNVSVSVMGFVN